MTLRAAEKISGLKITMLGNVDGGRREYCGVNTLGEFWVRARDDKDAAARLIDLHWKKVCDLVMKAQNYKCSDCMGIKPLQGHHKLLRSHGRVDSVSNVVALCGGCHEKRHGR